MIADEIAQQMRDAATKVTLLGASWAAECNRSERLEARIAELEAALHKIAALNDLSGYDDQVGAAYGHLAECETIARKALEQ